MSKVFVTSILYQQNIVILYIQFYLPLWEEVNLTIDSIPPEHFENISYLDPAVHNIILDKKSYFSPPLPPGPIHLLTLKKIQQFRGTQIVQQEELWNDSHLFMIA